VAYVDSPTISFDRLTKHEHLDDVLSFLSSSDTPLYAHLEHETVMGDQYDWPVDNLAQPTGVVAVQDGIELASVNAPADVRLRNGHHINRRGVQIADSARLVEQAGFDDLYSKEVRKQTIECLKEFEYNLHWSTFVQGAAGSAPQMQGLAAWTLYTGIDTSAVTIAGISVPDTYSATVTYNVHGGSFTASGNATTTTVTMTANTPHGLAVGDTVKFFDGGTAFSTTNGDFFGVQKTVASVTSTTVFTVLSTANGTLAAGNHRVYGGTNLSRDAFHATAQEAWAKGLDISRSLWLCGGGPKRVISGWSMQMSGSGATQTAEPINNRTIPAELATLVDTIRVYENDFGLMYINLDRYMNGGTPAAGASVTELMSWTVNSNIYWLMPSSTLLGFDDAYTKIPIMRDIQHVPLAKTGDRSTGMVLIQGGFKALNPRALVGFFGMAAA
jgi:hypothetical protein